MLCKWSQSPKNHFLRLRKGRHEIALDIGQALQTNERTLMKEGWFADRLETTDLEVGIISLNRQVMKFA